MNKKPYSEEDVNALMSMIESLENNSEEEVYNPYEERWGIRQVMEDINLPIPYEALYMGTVVQDGKPLLFNIRDTTASTVLVHAPIGHGFNQLIIAGIMMENENRKISIRYVPVDFVIITDDKERYKTLTAFRNVTLASLLSRECDDVVLSLASWAHANKTNKSVVLFVDCVDALMEHGEFDTIQNYKWLLNKGGNRYVSVIGRTLGGLSKNEEGLYKTAMFTSAGEEYGYKKFWYWIPEYGKNINFWSPVIDNE